MIPTEKELIDFVRKGDLVNFSMIAKFFGIKNATVTDLIKGMERKRLVQITRLGGSKVVRVK